MKFVESFKKISEFIKLEKGYVFVLTLALMPLILFGTKHLVDYQNLNKIQLLKSKSKDSSDSPDSQEQGEYYKVCAKEAALAVAKKWNPALTYKQQKSSMLRVADIVYNKSPTCYDNLLISEAIPGLNIPVQVNNTQKSEFNPLDIKTIEMNELTPDKKEIIYETKTSTLRRHYFQETSSPNYTPFPWLSFNNLHLTYTNEDLSLFTTIETEHDPSLFTTVSDTKNEFKEEEEKKREIGEELNKSEDEEENKLFRDFCIAKSVNPQTGEYLPNEDRSYVTIPQIVEFNNSSGFDDTRSKLVYIERKYPDDDTVQIECSDDRIKVITDKDVGYAIPAECNVDIILTIPTNAAASNKYNQDLNSWKVGSTYISSSTIPQEEAKSTPIYQISRAYQSFLKNFFYTRGVNVGVIPYSGNVSLPITNLFTNRSSWIRDPDRFVSNYFTNYDIWSYTDFEGKYLTPSIMGSMLYGTNNENGNLITDNSNNSNDFDNSSSGSDQLSGLLCRGVTTEEHGNLLTKGDLFSTENPTLYKFRKLLPNICHSTDANLLSMKCERSKDYESSYNINPFHILEPTPDLLYVYYMLTAFYPYHHEQNQSNFIFIPITWCNNLLQSWSSTGENEATDTETDILNLGRLSTPSKMEQGRKKALILIINKPDWFEPGELTYIGFNNDYSDTPAVESDSIRFDIDYSDTRKKYEDGTNYDGTIQGQKKILVYTTTRGNLNYESGYYQCASGVGRLTYPNKYLIKLVVAPMTSTKNTKETETSESTIQFLKINPNSNGVSLEIQQITETTTFYIPKDQLIEKYLEFSMKNIQLISAEITNRPYKMVDKKPDFGKGFRNPERSVYIDMMKMAEDGKFKYQTGNQDCNQMKYAQDTSGKIENMGTKYQDSTKSESSTDSSKKFEYVYSEPTSDQWKVASMMDSGQNFGWGDVTYGDGFFVAVAHSVNDDFEEYAVTTAAFIRKSDLDAGNSKWSSSVLPFAGNWSKVIYINNYFVAFIGGTQLGAYIHKDNLESGVVWKVLKLEDSEYFWNAIVCGGEYCVAISYNSDIAGYINKENFTPNAALTKMNLPSTSGSYWNDIAYGNGYFVAVSNGKAVYIHKDKIYSGASWIQMNIYQADNPHSDWSSITCGSKYFVVIDRNFGSYAYISKEDISPNAEWTIVSNRYYDYSSHKIFYINNFFISDFSFSSPCQYLYEFEIEKNNDWSEISAPMNNGSYRYFACGGDYLLYIEYIPSRKSGNNSFVYMKINTDFSDWKEEVLNNEQSNVNTSTNTEWGAVTYGGDYFVGIPLHDCYAFCLHQNAFNSNEFWSKSLLIDNTERDWYSITYGNGYFVAITENNNSCAAYIHENDLIAGYAWTQMKLTSANNIEWFSITFGNDYFVATGYECVAYIHRNDLAPGVIWKQKDIPTGSFWISVTYGADYFVATFDGPFAAYLHQDDLTSNNVTWEIMEQLPIYYACYSITYGNNYFVAIGYGGIRAAYISKDNLAPNATWSPMSFPYGSSWYSVVYGDGYFVAFESGNSNIAYIHIDDIVRSKSLNKTASWTSASHYSTASWCFGFGMHKFVILEDNSTRVFYFDVSENNYRPPSYSLWKSVSIREIDTSSRWSISCGSKYFVAVNYAYGNIAYYMNINYMNLNYFYWNRLYFPIYANWSCITYGNGCFIMIAEETCYAAYIYEEFIDQGYPYSNLVNLPSHTSKWSSIAYGNGYFVAISEDTCSAAYIHKDMLPMEAAWVTEIPKYTNKPIEATWENDYNLAIVNWNPTKLPNYTNLWGAITYNYGYFVAISTSGYAAYISKSDLISGVDWTYMKLSSSSQGKRVCITSGNEYFVAIQNESYIVNYVHKDNLTSGTTWSQMKLIDTKERFWSSITSGYGYFLAVANVSNYIAYIDVKNIAPGATWKQMNLPFSRDASAICYGSKYFIAISNDNHYFYCTINISPNIQQYTIDITTCSSYWVDVTYGDGYFVATGKRSHSDEGYTAYIHKNDFSLKKKWNLLKIMDKSYNEITYGNGYFITVNSKGFAYIHKNNLAPNASWTEVTLSFHCTGITYGNNHFVIVIDNSDKNNGNIAIYANKDNFTSQSSWVLMQAADGKPRFWGRVIYGSKYFVAITARDNITAYIHKDDLTADAVWNTTKLSDKIYSLSSIAYGGGYFVAPVIYNNPFSLGIFYISEDSIRPNAVWLQMNIPDSSSNYIPAILKLSGRTYNSNGGYASNDTSDIHITYGGGYFLVSELNVFDSYGRNNAYYIHKDDIAPNASFNLISLPISAYWYGCCFGWNSHEQEETTFENISPRFVVLNSQGPEISFCDLTLIDQEPISETSVKISNPFWYFYNNEGSHSTNHRFIMNYPGDMYFATNTDYTSYFSLGTTYYNIFQTTRNQDNQEINSEFIKYLGSDIYRITIPTQKMFKDIELGIKDYSWEVKDLENCKIPLMYAGITLPINITLYYGINGLTDHFYQWQSDSSGRILTLDPNETVKKVTRDACAKLKHDWEDNLRIYLIKFRTPDQYQNPITSKPEIIDYSYLDDCGSYLFDIRTEEELKNTLSEIADDIKSWAEFQEATNI